MNFIKQNFSLKNHNTFAIEAKTQFFATFINDQQLIEILEFCKKNDLKWCVLGGGANVIFKNDYQGCVIHPQSAEIKFENDLITADAGVEWDEFVNECVQMGFYGVENLSLIPGTVGAAPVQNIGAYGAEAKDYIEWVEYMDAQKQEIVKISKLDCKFGYRDSIFKNELKGKAIILRVAFKMTKNGELKMEYGDVKEKLNQIGKPSLKNIRQAIIEIRNSKLPNSKEIPNAGSFFKNPVVDKKTADEILDKYNKMPFYNVENGVKLAAGWMIEMAGWKGKIVGKVGIHDRQALVVVNVNNACGEEIMAFAKLVIDDIKEKFGVELETEVNII